MIKVILFCLVIQWKYCCLVQLDLGIIKRCMSWLFFTLGSWFLHLCIMSSIPSYPLTSGWHLSIRDYKGPLCMWAFIIYSWYHQIVLHGQITFLLSEEWVWVIAACPLWQCKTIVMHAWHWQCWSYFASRDAIWFLRQYFGSIITQWTKAPNFVVIPQHI